METQIAELVKQNEALHASMETIRHKKKEEKDESHQGEMDDPDPQPLSIEIWNAHVPENYKTAAPILLRWKE